MKRAFVRVSSVTAVLLVALTSSGCFLLPSAGWEVGVYAGANFPKDDDIFSSAPMIFNGDGTLNGEATVGGRIGQWFSLPITELLQGGVFLDASGVFQEVSSGDYTQVPVSLLPMVKVDLGLVQPYVGAGPSVIWSDLDLSTAVGNFQDNDVRFGLDARVGLAAPLLSPLGLFAEYRLTWSDQKFEDIISGTALDLEDETVTHHALFGISLQF